MKTLPASTDLRAYTTVAARLDACQRVYPACRLVYTVQGDCMRAAVYASLAAPRPLGTGLAAGTGLDARASALGRALDAAGFRGEGKGVPAESVPRPSREEMQRAMKGEQG